MHSADTLIQSDFGLNSKCILLLHVVPENWTHTFGFHAKQKHFICNFWQIFYMHCINTWFLQLFCFSLFVLLRIVSKIQHGCLRGKILTELNDQKRNKKRKQHHPPLHGGEYSQQPQTNFSSLCYTLIYMQRREK